MKRVRIRRPIRQNPLRSGWPVSQLSQLRYLPIAGHGAEGDHAAGLEVLGAARATVVERQRQRGVALLVAQVLPVLGRGAATSAGHRACAVRRG